MRDDVEDKFGFDSGTTLTPRGWLPVHDKKLFKFSVDDVSDALNLFPRMMIDDEDILRFDGKMSSDSMTQHADTTCDASGPRQEALQKLSLFTNSRK